MRNSLSAEYFTDPHFHEAVRLLEMRIVLTKADEQTEFDYPGCPQLHFDGYVRGVQSRNADVKGFIQRFLDGTIRWKFVSGLFKLTSSGTDEVLRKPSTMVCHNGGE